MKSGNLNFLETSGQLQASNGTALPFYYVDFKMQNLSDDEDVNRTLENIKEDIQPAAKESLGLHELKQHKPWFDEDCLGFLEQRERAKMQWMQDPSKSNVDILNNVRRFRDKKKAYLRARVEELETNSKSKNIRGLYRGINDFKKGY